MNAHLPKPFRFQELAAMLDKWLTSPGGEDILLGGH
jgi:hypothetical protein